ncbi:ATP-binding cassette domain-containing protein [Paractinoplanes atraurantiacus]|uniref:Putative ABC transport system ATP-binding protein/tungstate transport system ATP-binding protein n=1 Tax=Paractinoplanes atraurantiacus TaxID=1036182 RepID=A0A285KTT7_9ACTN|nr:ATP-binding cassette domain-containing protein [Actinoplanes atraurantiacus]SNY74806.1 putative ABC transport system ATP-binding protein/tungstate transport system ATP-binding protein [Actinoplanes atraurantiacus]
MPLIEVHEVSHSRGGTRVLDGVDLTLDAATTAVLAGRSGSGKSTLCHLIAGVMTPTSGRVQVAGRPAQSPDWATVSLLPQRLALEPTLTVAENVLLPAGLRRSAADPAVLDRLGLSAIADRPARDTSLGEQQRTALARALILGPAVAVLDEPTAHQDDEHVQLVLDALATAATTGTLVLVATHDQRVIDIAGQVIRLHSGRVVPT